MQTTQIADSRSEAAPQNHPAARADAGNANQWHNFSIIRRNGAVVGFEPGKIAIAMTKAFLAVNGGQGAASARVRELVETLTAQAVNALVRNRPSGGTFHIEEVQDQVELARLLERLQQVHPAPVVAAPEGDQPLAFEHRLRVVQELQP